MSGLAIAQPQYEPLVDAFVAADYLGFSAVTVRRMARRGELPCIPFSAGQRTVWRFRISELEKFTQELRTELKGVPHAA